MFAGNQKTPSSNLQFQQLQTRSLAQITQGHDTLISQMNRLSAGNLPTKTTESWAILRACVCFFFAPLIIFRRDLVPNSPRISETDKCLELAENFEKEDNCRGFLNILYN